MPRKRQRTGPEDDAGEEFIWTDFQTQALTSIVEELYGAGRVGQPRLPTARRNSDVGSGTVVLNDVSQRAAWLKDIFSDTQIKVRTERVARCRSRA